MIRKALIVKVKKNENGDITDVMLDNGKIYSIDEAVSLSREGMIEDIVVKQGENGREYFRKSPTSLGDDSFNHIPQF